MWQSEQYQLEANDLLQVPQKTWVKFMLGEVGGEGKQFIIKN